MAESGSEASPPQPQPAEQSLKSRLGNQISRRGALTRIASATAAAGAYLFGNPKPAEAQSETSGSNNKDSKYPSHEKPKTADVVTTETLKAKQDEIEKAAMHASYYMGGDKVKVEFLDAGNLTSVKSHYHPDKQMGTIEDPVLFIRLSYKDNQPFDYTKLQVAEELAEIVRASKGEYIGDQFLKLFLESTGIDLKSITQGDNKDYPKLSGLRGFFDYANYTDGVSRDDMFSFRKDIHNELYDRAIALVTVKPAEVAANLMRAPETDQKSLANVFAGALKLQLDGVLGGTWDNLGLDKENIYKIIKLSKNPKLKSYFDEKIAHLKN